MILQKGDLHSMKVGLPPAGPRSGMHSERWVSASLGAFETLTAH